MGKNKQQIRDSGLNYKKGLGQNFIYDEALLASLVECAGVTKKDNVLEIGPGAGTLTKMLCQAANKVLALEIDDRLIPLLKGYLSGFDNVDIVQGDVLDCHLPELTKPLGEGFLVVANIPYYITTPLITLLLDSGLNIKRIAVMVQAEVAEKILAEPGTDEYGMLAVKCQYYSEPRIAMAVQKESFTPVPKVDSAFVVMEKRDTPPVNADEKLFFKTARAAFLMRRKTMANNLSTALGMSREKALEALKMANLDEKVRGEKLSLEEFAALSNAIGALQ
jgi:dimethyladenosine transferase